MKQRNKSDVSETVPLLDEKEQDAIVQSLKEQAIRQSKTQRLMFFVVYIIISLIFIYLLAYKHIYPYHVIQHQSFFTHIISYNIFVIFYIISLYCIIISALIIKYSLDVKLRVYLHIGFLLAFICLISWLYIFWLEGVTNPLLYWLPFANIISLLLAIYVDSDVNSMIREADALNMFKYQPKNHGA